MKAEIFVNISVTLQNIFNFGENEFYKLAKDDEDLYLYGKNAFVSFENFQPSLHELSFPDSSFAQKNCLRAQLKTCSNFVHHVSTIGSSRLVCGSYFAQPKCEFNNNYFEAHNFISDGSESSAENGFVRKLRRDSSFLAVAEVSRGSHSGIFTLETSTTGEKPFSLTDKPLDELFPAQVRLHTALNGNGAAYLLGTENEDSPFLAKLCLNSDEHQAPVIESPTSWSSVVRANLRCCDEERNCRFTRPIETRMLRLKNQDELLLVLFQSQENTESALCLFSSNELDAFFGSFCSSSRQSLTLTSTAILTTQAQSFDVDVKRAALRIALMETDEESLTLVSKVTVRLDENNAPISVNANFRARLNLSSHGESKIRQVAVFKDSVVLRGDEQVLKMDFEACGVYKTCGTCVAIGDVDCGWDKIEHRCSSKINASSHSCDISPVPVLPKSDFLAETMESIRINTSDVEVFDDFAVLLDGDILPRGLFPGQYHKDRSLLILNVLDRPDSGEYTVNFLFRDFVVFQSSFSISTEFKKPRDGHQSVPVQRAAGSPLAIIIGVSITFVFAILLLCCCVKGRMQRERTKSLELAKQQRLPPAGQSHSGSEFEIALLKKSDSITTREKFIQSREQIDGGSDGRSDRDNSEAFMSCSSRPESVQSDERNAAMVIFPDGTIKKIAAEKVQKMSNHMADVTLDFAENEKFIHGTLRKSQKKKKETN